MVKSAQIRFSHPPHLPVMCHQEDEPEREWRYIYLVALLTTLAKQKLCWVTNRRYRPLNRFKLMQQVSRSRVIRTEGIVRKGMWRSEVFMHIRPCVKLSIGLPVERLIFGSICLVKYGERQKKTEGCGKGSQTGLLVGLCGILIGKQQL